MSKFKSCPHCGKMVEIENTRQPRFSETEKTALEHIMFFTVMNPASKKDMNAFKIVRAILDEKGGEESTELNREKAIAECTKQLKAADVLKSVYKSNKLQTAKNDAFIFAYEGILKILNGE